MGLPRAFQQLLAWREVACAQMLGRRIGAVPVRTGTIWHTPGSCWVRPQLFDGFRSGRGGFSPHGNLQTATVATDRIRSTLFRAEFRPGSGCCGEDRYICSFNNRLSDVFLAREGTASFQQMTAVRDFGYGRQSYAY
jgi:hypothetical protein